MWHDVKDEKCCEWQKNAGFHCSNLGWNIFLMQKGKKMRSIVEKSTWQNDVKCDKNNRREIIFPPWIWYFCDFCMERFRRVKKITYAIYSFYNIFFLSCTHNHGFGHRCAKQMQWKNDKRQLFRTSNSMKTYLFGNWNEYTRLDCATKMPIKISFVIKNHLILSDDCLDTPLILIAQSNFQFVSYHLSPGFWLRSHTFRV